MNFLFLDFWDSYYIFLSFRKLGYRAQILIALLCSTFSTFRLFHFFVHLHCDSLSFCPMSVSERYLKTLALILRTKHYSDELYLIKIYRLNSSTFNVNSRELLWYKHLYTNVVFRHTSTNLFQISLFICHLLSNFVNYSYSCWSVWCLSPSLPLNSDSRLGRSHGLPLPKCVLSFHDFMCGIYF